MKDSRFNLGLDGFKLDIFQFSGDLEAAAEAADEKVCVIRNRLEFFRSNPYIRPFYLFVPIERNKINF